MPRDLNFSEGNLNNISNITLVNTSVSSSNLVLQSVGSKLYFDKQEIGTGGASQNLQQVTDEGNDTTTSINANGGLSVGGYGLIVSSTGGFNTVGGSVSIFDGSGSGFDISGGNITIDPSGGAGILNIPGLPSPYNTDDILVITAGGAVRRSSFTPQDLVLSYYRGVESLGDLSSNALSFDQGGYYIKAYSLNTNSFDVDSITSASAITLPIGSQAIFYVTHTGGTSNIAGTITEFFGASNKVNYEDITMSGGNQAVITMTKGADSNIFISASSYE